MSTISNPIGGGGGGGGPSTDGWPDVLGRNNTTASGDNPTLGAGDELEFIGSTSGVTAAIQQYGDGNLVVTDGSGPETLKDLTVNKLRIFDGLYPNDRTTARISFQNSPDIIEFIVTDTEVMQVSEESAVVGSGFYFGISSTSTPGGTADVRLVRTADGKLEVTDENGTQIDIVAANISAGGDGWSDVLGRDNATVSGDAPTLAHGDPIIFESVSGPAAQLQVAPEINEYRSAPWQSGMLAIRGAQGYPSGGLELNTLIVKDSTGANQTDSMLLYHNGVKFRGEFAGKTFGLSWSSGGNWPTDYKEDAVGLISPSENATLDAFIDGPILKVTRNGGESDFNNLGVIWGQKMAWQAWNAGQSVAPASNPAESTTRNGHNILAFDSVTDESVYFEATAAPLYGGNNSSFCIDLFWAAANPADAGSGLVLWQVERDQFARGSGAGFSIDDDDATNFDTITASSGWGLVPPSGNITKTTIVLQNASDWLKWNDPTRLRVRRRNWDVEGIPNVSTDAHLVRVVYYEV